MDNQSFPLPNTPAPEIPPVSPLVGETPIQPPLTQPPSVPVAPKKQFDIRILIIGIIILAIIGGIIAMTWKPQETTVLPTPTPTPSPTPVQRVTVPVATQSAYRNLQAAIATLSASIGSTQVNDTTLSPPVIELSLGFPN